MDCSRSDEIKEPCQTSRLESCDVCEHSEAKYVCPLCEIKTCCLQCNKVHKKEMNCSGERDKTKYVPLKNKDRNTNLVILSDYRMLEDISRIQGILHKTAKPLPRLRHNMRKVHLAVTARKTNLKLLPSIMKPSQQNSTIFCSKQNLIFWHIEWYFMNTDTSIHSNKVSEIERISSLVGKYLRTEDEDLKKKLMVYQAAGHSGIKVLLRAENKEGSKYYKVYTRDTLRECLAHKTIMEYPVFYVLLADHIYGFDIIDSDEDEDRKDDNHLQDMLGLKN